MEPGKTIFISKFYEMTGHTGEHLLRPTANYMKLKLIGRLPPCEVCAKSKNQTKKCTDEENKETTNQNWIKGIYRYMFFQASQHRRKQTLTDFG